MKRCVACQKDYSDRMSFCTECGKPLIEVTQGDQVFCSSCGTKNAVSAKFCIHCGMPIEQTGQNGREEMARQQKQSKMPLVVGLVALMLVVGAAAAAGFFLARNQSKKPDTVAQEATSADIKFAEETQEPEITEEPTRAPESTEESTVMAVSVEEYQDYYDRLENKFKKYILTTKSSRKIETYSNMLKDAITQKNVEQCKAMENKLDDLESQIKSSSRRKIDSLKEKLAGYEKRSYAKKAIQGAVYKKAKRKGRQFEIAGNYAGAQLQYLECIDRLKEAREKEQIKKNEQKKKNETIASRSSGSTKYYKPVYTDNDTYYQLSTYYLSSNDVRNLNSEQIRYYINTIFAYMGYRFSKDYIQKFFNYQSWYSGGWTNNQQDIINALNASNSVIAYNYEILKGAR